MKIISLPNDWKHEFVCEDCEAVLEADGQDVICSKDLSNMNNHIYYVKCANCSAWHTLCTAEIPTKLKKEAEERASKLYSSTYEKDK